MIKMQTPAQRLSLRTRDPHSSIESFTFLEQLKSSHDPIANPTNTARYGPYEIAWGLMTRASRITANYYLSANRHQCEVWSQKLGEAFHYYLLGDWKEKQPHDDGMIDAKRWFEKQPSLTWTLCFDMDLGWVAVGRHWELVGQILAFVQPSIAADDDGPAVRGYYLGLAQWWSDRTDISWIDTVKQIRGAGSKKYHLLCDVVTGISAKDTGAIQKGLSAYVTQFLKQRDHDEQFPLAATFLWNVAQHDGLTLEFPDDVDKFLFRLPNGT